MSISMAGPRCAYRPTYRASACQFEAAAAEFPRGHADLKDQLRRAAAATVRHIAEGANRIHPRDKSARFTLARAECGECEAAIEMAGIVGPYDGSKARQVLVEDVEELEEILLHI